ncbi:peptidyl-alpha-hydroxyglycine alpha-amidating lyase 1-like isoform X2 [Ceratina calcarata]|uniref:peptidylamidoglycolate lyase n=1 Tax=Ceratina calcarata TaxID=156304 RepID=A0AAJ7JBW1_9HYME|nr:peptidyl-alpha-hydroxyglycine alpha-amidating lyase 1-like isoform X2 [Ceratina calcarata]
MLHLRHDIACCISVLCILNLVKADSQDYLNFEHRAIHLPDKKFSFREYSDYSDNDERDKGSLVPQWDQIPVLYHNEHLSQTLDNEQVSDAFDKNIIWDSLWAHDIKFGQITAVSIDPNGDIAIFHRGSRIWDTTTFDDDNRFDRNKGPVSENTLILLDKAGRKLLEWGANMFYLPHGLTIDMHGNYWVTDVALHQVLKFDAKDIALMKSMARLRKREYNQESVYLTDHESNNMYDNYVPKPSMILGEAFVPGNDAKRFCKPTAVAVQSNGEFFVSDGYCNSRIIKFNANGEEILHWGRHWGRGSWNERNPPPNAFYVPHALALASEYNLIFVADRENGRVLSFFASNGTFHREYKYSIVGTKIYSVAYARDKLYLVNGPMFNSNVHVRGFVVDMNSGNIVSQFGPGHDMSMPHDIAVSDDSSEIYVVELNNQTVYRFLQDISASEQTGNSVARANPHHEPAPLTDNDINNPSGGCLLIMRKRMRWEAERRENFKLSSLLEKRRGKSFKISEKRPNPRDFSKLNTEPETSEDEYPGNSITRVI